MDRVKTHNDPLYGLSSEVNKIVEVIFVMPLLSPFDVYPLCDANIKW